MSAAVSRERTEFYTAEGGIGAVDVLMPLRFGDYINIRKKKYKVVKVTFAIDYSDNPIGERVARCNVDLEEATP